MKKYLLLLICLPLLTVSSFGQEQTDTTSTQQTTELVADSAYISADKQDASENINHYNAIFAKKEINISITSVLKGLLGMLVLLAIAWTFSTNRNAIAWGTVGKGLLLQAIIAFSVLQFPLVQDLFGFLGKCFTSVLDWTKAGSEFLLGPLMDVKNFGFIFAFQILPTIIFFSALTSLLFYLGIIQKVVWLLASVMTKLMKLSGAESLATAGNIFLGQTESPLMVKAYIPTMTKSELMLVMTAGMATMAGGVLAAYIQMLGNGDPVLTVEFAKHLLSASVMAAPGAVVVSKILVPQTEKIDNTVEVTKERIGKNVLDAVSNGTGEGLKLAANVAAMLLVFYALIAGLNFIFKFTGRIGIHQLLMVIGGFIIGMSVRFLLSKKGSKSVVKYFNYLLGLLIIVAITYYVVDKDGTGSLASILGLSGFLGLFSIAALTGSLSAGPLINSKHTKKLHVVNGVFAGIFVLLFVLMLVWKNEASNLNSIVALATQNAYSNLSLEFLLGYTFSPLMWLIGVPSSDMTLVGQLLGQKLILTEFVAYGELSEFIKLGSFASVKSMIMATYILCGFANFASIGIQIGGIGSLAPNQKPLLAAYGMRALLGGTLAALVSATMVGMIIG